MSHWYDFGASLERWNPDPDLTHDPKPVPYDPATWGEPKEVEALRPDRSGRLPGCPCGLTGPAESPRVADLDPACPHHGYDPEVRDLGSEVG